MFNKKLKEEINDLKEMHKSLSSRISVLEFERDNEGKTYRIQLARGGFHHTWITYLNEHKTKVIEIFKYHGNFDYYTQNGKYLEFREIGCLKRAYEIKGDDLVEIDIKLYKAWLESEKDKEKVIDKSFTDSLSSVFDSFNKCADVLEAAVKAAEAKPSNKVDIYEVETPDGEKVYAVVEDSGEVKQTKKLGDLTCDEIKDCENCPMKLINCTRNCRDTDIPFTEMLKKVLSNPDTGEIEDPELYSLFKARLDKPVKDDE